jgi:molybdate transport system ATP-binding protein
MQEHTPNTNQDNHAPALVEFKNVSLVYRALPALKDINWRIDKGQQWACLGPNGAGKTSIARILCQLAPHYSGELYRASEISEKGIAYVCFEEAKAMCDRDKKLDDSEFRADVSDPGTTVQRAIIGDKSPDSRFDLWTEKLAMRHILNRGLRFISTGEMRKTLLVKALIENPALLILDNPLDGLDIASQATMSELISDLMRSDLSVILLCRQMEDIPGEITHVLALAQGEVVTQGPAMEVLANTAVTRLMNPPLPPLDNLPTPTTRPYELPSSGPLLELNNVSVSYGELNVLTDVNWVLERDMHCCVSGPNGCGKTTLLSLITGDNHKAYGQDITLFGIRRGSGESIWDIKQKYGQVDTQLHLNFARGMKVVEVVVSGFFDTIGLYDQWGDTQRQHAEQWLRALGLGDIIKDSFDALSFGLQRMVLLARAMVKSPIILLLDEPTLGLDGYHRRLILRAIDHIAENSDTQIIFVSHSVGDMPNCINQQLRFVPTNNGFVVETESTTSGRGATR